MKDRSPPFTRVPEEQKTIAEKLFHPSETFVEFRKETLEQSIPERFEKVVAQFPDRLAVWTGDRSLTYDELNRTANRIARAILAKRGPASEPIALLFEHGIDVIAAIFGVLKTGKFYVMIDSSFPRERNSYILENSGAGLIVVNSSNAPLANDLKNDACALMNIDKIDDASCSENLGFVISHSDPMNIRYTSGSTGVPKGVIRTHRSSEEVADLMHVFADDRFSLVHSLSFGSSAMDLYLSLLNGASLFPFDMKAHDVQQLAGWLREQQITICHLTPGLFRQLAEVVSSQEGLPKLRLIRLSGSPIGRLEFDLYRKIFSSGTLLEIGMGSTEAGLICSATLDQKFSFPSEGTIIGYPVRGIKVLLLDEKMCEVESGEIGEIAVKGRSLASGYWEKAKLNGVAFLSDPNRENEDVYLTGDLGRRLPDGFLIHLGRKDFQVKLRGYRVSITEVERACIAHPRVKDAGVSVWDREDAEKYLVAYVVPATNAVLSVDELRDFLKEKLPDYMIPSAIMFLEALPLINGKLDRSALPKPADKRPDLSTPYVPAQNTIEEKLARIWEKILMIHPVGIHDNFFDLGGHSLAATRVVSQVIQRFQLELPIQSLFQSPTVAEMTAVIMEHQTKKLGEKDLERILAELETMSDDEAQKSIT